MAIILFDSSWPLMFTKKIIPQCRGREGLGPANSGPNVSHFYARLESFAGRRLICHKELPQPLQKKEVCLDSAFF